MSIGFCHMLMFLRLTARLRAPFQPVTRWLLMIGLFIMGGLIGIRGPGVAAAQSLIDSYDVFIARAPNVANAATQTANTSPDTIYFVSVRSGLSTPIALLGKGYRLLGTGVVFQNRTDDSLQMAYPDGQSGPLGYIGSAPGVSVAWAVSSDHNWIVWSLSHSEAGSLLSDMFIARADGTSKLLVLHTSAPTGSTGSGLYPLDISNDGATVIYTRQVDPVSAPDRYPSAADVYRLDLSSGQFTHLVGEPRCACGTAFTPDGRTVLRLDLDSVKHAITAHFIDTLVNGDQLVNPFATIPSWTVAQAGDVLLSDKGTLAVYSAANGAFTDKRTQYVVILIDAAQRQQRVLIPARPDRLRPVAFTRGGVILVGTNNSGTYRVTLTDGTLTPIATDSFLGTLSN
jgi:hypothetical protein